MPVAAELAVLGATDCVLSLLVVSLAELLEATSLTAVLVGAAELDATDLATEPDDATVTAAVLVAVDATEAGVEATSELAVSELERVA